MWEKKVHYKMYKAGKNWIFAALMAGILLGGISNLTDASTVRGDTVSSAVQAETSSSETSSAAQVSGPLSIK